LHARTTARAEDTHGKEKLVRYILRPPVAQERRHVLPDELVRVELKRPFADGTTAVDMAPLSLLCRLAASVPPPRAHTVHYAGVLGSASKLRPLDVDKCSGCGGRLKLVRFVTRTETIDKILGSLGEPTDVPGLSPARDPHFYKSRVLRRYRPVEPPQRELFAE
jgi:hypothetical protein